MRRLQIVALLTARLMLSASLAHAEGQVGSAAAVRNDVKGSVAGQLNTGSPVYQDETVTAGADSSAQLLFRDKSSLTLGPSSRVRIDKFVYDPNKNTGESALRLAKGALRFVSGSQKPEKYSVSTPLATMGVRGSVAETYVSPLGYEFFVLIEGEIEVCARSGCKSITMPGQYIVVFPDGTVAPPAPWPGPMLDLTASVAFIEVYFSQIVSGERDVLPHYRNLGDANKAKDFSHHCFGEGCGGGTTN
jgi:hypothetical protein